MKRTRFSLCALILMLVLVSTQLLSCGAPSGNNAGDSYAGGDKIENAAPGFSDIPLSTPDMEGKIGTKVIKSYRLSAESTNFEASVQAIQALVSEYGGYVESASTSNQSLSEKDRANSRTASYTLRIPAEQVDAFVSSLGSSLHLISNSSTVEDVSETYYSIEARLEELQVERDSLLDILDAPETKKDYDLWLTVKQRLSEVTQQIAVYQGQLNRYDSKIAYSTVDLTVSEVLNYSATAEDNSFGSRLGAAFSDGWNSFVEGAAGFALLLAEASPFLILLLVIGAASLIITLTVIKKKRAAREHSEKEDATNA